MITVNQEEVLAGIKTTEQILQEKITQGAYKNIDAFVRFYRWMMGTDYAKYISLICSDGKYRYDRSTNPVCDGRCTGTCTEFTNEFNLMNDSYGNRYELHKEFLDKFGSEEKNKEQLWKNKDWSLFLKEHNLLTIDDMVGVIYES